LERLAATDSTPLPIRWTKDPPTVKNGSSTNLYAWDPRDTDNPIASLTIRWNDLSSQNCCNTILDAQWGLSKRVKDIDSWEAVVMDEGYRVRSRFGRGKTEGALTLILEIAWRNGVSYFDLRNKTSVLRARKAFDAVFADGSPKEPWVPQDFYGNAHVPPLDAKVCSQLHNDLLDCTLYPYQRRTVQFMLDREGAMTSGDASTASVSSIPVESTTALDEEETKISFLPELDIDGRPFYVSRTIGTVYRNFNVSRAIRGGILAEEMGLGKTVEMIALMMLHQPPENEALENFEKPFSKATLIVTPSHLLEQWQDELSIHAPSLRVRYFGRALLDKDDDFDVLLCTYDTLARQFWYVNAGRDFTLRHEKKYRPQKNPLLEKTWWRVCLDEAQMIDQGVSHAATVAKLIPRVNAWAISGTPFKSHVEDLRGLLLFLGYDPFHHPKIWSRVDRSTFKDIFGRIAIRHSKDRVRDELQLPPQKRIVVTVPFMAMEEQNYATLFKQMCEDCRFGLDGDPLGNEFYGDSQQTIDKMRSWLRRLRQTCLHPHVGTKNRRAIGTGEKPLRTVDEVLDAMIKGHFAHVVNHERSIIEALIQKGHVYAFEKQNPQRARKSLQFYQTALDKVTELVKQCESAQAKSTDDHHDDPARKDKIEKGKGKKRVITSMRQNLRLALELQHTCHFFVATAFFQTKENEEITVKDSEEFKQLEEQEIVHYEAAKAIRRQLLTESREDAEKSMQRVEELETHKINLIDISQALSGLENIRFMEKYVKISKVLNQQADLLEKWQNRVRIILLQSLIDADKDQEQTGEEYEESTKVQDELYVMFQALRTVAADRQGLLTGQINYLTEHEAKEAIKAAQKDKDINDASRLLLELFKDWEDLRPKPELNSVRGIIGELRSLLTSLEWRRGGLRDDRTTQSRLDSEITLIREHLRSLDAELNAETKSLEALEKQIGIFRDCMNVRLTYYRRLQAISDAVQPFKEVLDEQLDRAHLDSWKAKTEQSQSQLSIHQSKLRFLQHLRDHATEDQSRECIICRDRFESGILTSCGHQYCKDCLKEWFVSHRNCPVSSRVHQMES
jgi:E3 ubiquitin-protein ligase SHPRH